MIGTIVTAIGFLFVMWAPPVNEPVERVIVDATGQPPAAVVSQAGRSREARPAGLTDEQLRWWQELYWCLALGFCPEEGSKPLVPVVNEIRRANGISYE